MVLTPEEREVLESLARNFSNKEIAQAMTVGEETVKWRLKNLFGQLDAGTLVTMIHPMARAGTPPTGFEGNKASLPSKPCVACGRPMSWRRRWAANWDEVKYCSDACRRARPVGGRGG